MKKERLKEILEKFVIYLYPNFKIVKECDFFEEEYVVLSDDGSLNIKGNKQDTNGYNIASDQGFVPQDEKLINTFIEEVDLIEGYKDLKKEYYDALIMQALNNAISSTLSENSHDTISMIINELSRFSERTYEGKAIRYGVFINDKLKCSNKDKNVHFSNFIKSPYSAVLTDGTESFIEVDSEGYIVKYQQVNYEKNDNGLAPYDYTRILEHCDESITAVVLNEKGDIYIFHDFELKYTKRGGRWNPYSHKEAIDVIYDRSKNDNMTFARAVYLTALDVSFSKNGGIISFLDENEVQNALKHINIRDICNKEYYEMKIEQLKETNEPEYTKFKDISFDEFLRRDSSSKSCVINRLIKDKSFGFLSRKLRHELVSIDGATILDYNGNFVAIGAIVKIEGGSEGGGRLAAAKTLAHYGIAIEVSADSSIRAFALNDKSQVEPILSISEFK